MDNFKTLVDVLINDEVKGIQSHERNIIIGNTPELLQQYAGFSQNQILISARAISKIHFDHGISASLIHRIPELLSNPKSIFRSVTHPESAVVFTYELKIEAPILIVLQKDRLIGRSKFNVCASMYGKEGENPETKWERDGLLLWKSG